MTDRDVVERVAKLWGRAVVPLSRCAANHRPRYVTTIKGSPAATLMQVVRPHLSSSRQTQVDAALATWHGRAARWDVAGARCSVRGCARPMARRGLCKPHYDSWWKTTKRGLRSAFVPTAAPPTWSAINAEGCADTCHVAWLAGLLEGEGCFTATPTNANTYPIISVEMCDKHVIDRVRSILGSPSVTSCDHANPAWNEAFRTRVSGHAAASWMRILRPLMGQRRGAAIDAALAGYAPIRLIDPPETCIVPDCAEPHRSRGLCHKHYMSWMRDQEKGRRPRVTPLR